MATRLKVTYLDGRTVEVVPTPRAQVTAEQSLGGITDKNKIHATYFTAWASLFKAGKEATIFEQWLDMIEDVEPITSLHSIVKDALIDRELQDTPEATQMLQLAAKLEPTLEKALDPIPPAPSPGSSSS